MEALIEILLAWSGRNSQYNTAALPAPTVIELVGLISRLGTRTIGTRMLR